MLSGTRVQLECCVVANDIVIISAGRYQGMRDVHRRLAYAIDVQMVMVKSFVRDLQKKAKVRCANGAVVFHLNNNCKCSSSSSVFFLVRIKILNNTCAFYHNKECDSTRLSKLSYEENPEGWENFSCILNSAEFFLDLLQEAEVSCDVFESRPSILILHRVFLLA